MKFATTKCPKCGQKQMQLLNGNGFLGKEETRCNNCGQLYSTAFNCLGKTNEEVTVKEEKENVKIMSKFSTWELVEELKRRRASV